jgi:hypothetical protein
MGGGVSARTLDVNGDDGSASLLAQVFCYRDLDK